MSVLTQAAILFAAAVIMVPIFQRLGLGSVLGFLAAGLVAGPFGIGAIGSPDKVLHFAELGVVMLLFVIGLELEPKRLWSMRRAVFGTGGLQVVGTAGLVFALGVAFGLAWQAAVLVGLALALSSTAFAIQLLNERNERALPHGRTAFAILLAQDLAVIPILAIVPLLAMAPEAAAGDDAPAPVWAAVAFVGVLASGRLVLRPLLRLAVSARSHEISIGAALLVVIAVSALFEHVGLSMALGAFVAGVLLADSEYRHELEANIEPFKGLLLGLFFMAVGMNTDLGLLVDAPLTVVGIAFGLLALKTAVLFGLGVMSGLDVPGRWRLAAALSQGGEFAFVIMEAGRAGGVVDGPLGGLVTLAVTLSMGLTPAAFALTDWALARRAADAGDARDFDPIDPDDESEVVIAGFGRYGQIVARLLSAKKVHFTAIEPDPAQVDFVRRFGNKVFYGDPTRHDILRVAVTPSVRVFVLAIDDVKRSLAVAEEVRRHYPDLTIHARARNRAHVHALRALGVDHITRETYASSLETAVEVLEDLDFGVADALEAARRFREHDEELLDRQFAIRDDEQAAVRSAKEWAAELEQLFASDDAERR